MILLRDLQYDLFPELLPDINKPGKAFPIAAVAVFLIWSDSTVWMREETVSIFRA